MKNNSDKCPMCGEECSVLNIGTDLWGYCDADKIKWHISTNLVSSGRNETPPEWEENAEKLSHYQEFAKPPVE